MKKELSIKYPRKIKGYDIGVSRWEVYAKDIDDNYVRETGGIIFIAGEFANVGLSFDFTVDGKEDHEHEFGGVLKQLLEHPETFSIEGHEDDYSRQEIEMLAAVRKRALEVKREENADV